MIKTKRGGGPKTPEGKLTTSKNALKTGVYSRMVVIPGESEEEFQALLDQFVSDFSPRDIVEASIVRELAVLTWKRLRLEKIEHSEIIRTLSKPISENELLLFGVHLPEDCLWMLKDLPELTSQYIQTNRKILKFIDQVNQQAPISDELIAQFPEMCPEFVERAFTLSREFWTYDPLNAPWTMLAELKYEGDGQKKSFVHFALKTLRARAKQVIGISGMLETIQNGVTAIKQKRLLASMFSERSNRASDDISRAFFRILGELRRQQKWRKDMGIIDVPDANEDVE
jgi:hypothetical protein